MSTDLGIVRKPRGILRDTVVILGHTVISDFERRSTPGGIEHYRVQRFHSDIRVEVVHGRKVEATIPVQYLVPWIWESPTYLEAARLVLVVGASSDVG